MADGATAASARVAPWDANAVLEVAGVPRPRVDAEDKVTGRARYTADVHPPGMLQARVLRSPHPHARIRRIDTSRAEQLRGVRAVLHAGNTPEIAWYGDSRLFVEVARFVGDEIAAVAADSRDIADDALRLIEVEYEPLPHVTDLVAALEPGAPQVRDGGNAGEPEVYERGEPQRMLEEADVLVDETYCTPVALHNAMESHGSVADWQGSHLTLWDSTQGLFQVREQVAQSLGLAEDRVRVAMEHMGGGFGAKQVAWKQSVIAALLSKVSGRPVQLLLDRNEENLAVGNRSATRQRVRLGARRDGTLLAIDARIDAQIGAYDAGGESSLLSGPYQRLYRCDHVRTEQRPVYTHTGPAVAFRAPGHVEAAFALESAMDELAQALKMDPVELRLQNYAERDQLADLPYSSPGGLRLCYERAGEAFGWRRSERGADERWRRGVGVAAHDWGGSGHPPAYAWVKLNQDGTADVVTGTQDLGTGTRTGLTIIAAEELGLPPERVELHLGDTSFGPYSPTSNGSTTLASLGPAVRQAAAEVRRQLLEEAASLRGEEAGRLAIHAGWVVRDGATPEPLMLVEEVTAHIAPRMIQGSGARDPNADGYSVRTFGAQFVEVEVDTVTGQVRVLRATTAHDCGRVINPVTVNSQVEGGLIQGLGYGLMEERIVDDESGVVLNANLEEYHVPTAADAPAIEHRHPNVADPYANTTGAKGIGEPPIVPTAPAIANALYDAIGVRFRDLPVTPARVIEALEQRRSAEETS